MTTLVEDSHDFCMVVIRQKFLSHHSSTKNEDNHVLINRYGNKAAERSSISVVLKVSQKVHLRIYYNVLIIAIPVG